MLKVKIAYGPFEHDQFNSMGVITYSINAISECAVNKDESVTAITAWLKEKGWENKTVRIGGGTKTLDLTEITTSNDLVVRHDRLATCTTPEDDNNCWDYGDYGDYYDEEDDDTPVFYQIKLIQILDESGEALDLIEYPEMLMVSHWHDLSSSPTLRSL